MSGERRRPSFITGVFLGALLALAVTAGVRELTADGFDDLPLSEQARQTIEQRYFEAVDPDELEHSSVRGMVRELRRSYDDRFSHYFDPEDLQAFNESTSGRFSGVGLTVSEVPKGLRVASVLPSTPAERANIQEGDVITAVDGRSIAGTSSEVATARIKGPPGTEVKLRVRPADGGPPREITLERASVRIPSTAGRMLRIDGRKVAYVRYATFSKGSHGELREEIQRLRERGAEGLILDLRANGGGLLNEAVLAASLFVEDGVIVTTESRARGERVYDAVGDAMEPLPTVVLVNRDTASAAEILAAALQSHGLAEVVGTRSFGKGTFQEIIHLPAGGALDLTVGEYLTADGISLAGEGVKPDIRAPDNPETRRDEALERAKATLAPRLP